MCRFLSRHGLGIKTSLDAEWDIERTLEANASILILLTLVSKAGREVREEFYADHRPYEELYSLEEDPHEQTNLADNEEYESVSTELEDELYEWMKRTDDPLLDGPVLPSDYDDIALWEVPDKERF